jgi:hypothetical protein
VSWAYDGGRYTTRCFAVPSAAETNRSSRIVPLGIVVRGDADGGTQLQCPHAAVRVNAETAVATNVRG